MGVKVHGKAFLCSLAIALLLSLVLLFLFGPSWIRNDELEVYYNLLVACELDDEIIVQINNESTLVMASEVIDDIARFVGGRSASVDEETIYYSIEKETERGELLMIKDATRKTGWKIHGFWIFSVESGSSTSSERDSLWYIFSVE